MTQSLMVYNKVMGRKASKARKHRKTPAKQNRGEVVTVYKVQAKVRSNFGQWVNDHKAIIRTVIIAVALIALTIAGIVTLF